MSNPAAAGIGKSEKSIGRGWSAEPRKLVFGADKNFSLHSNAPCILDDLTAPHRKKGIPKIQLETPLPYCRHLANLVPHVNVVKSIRFQAGVFVNCRCQFRNGGYTTAQLPGNGPGHDYIDSYCTSFLCPPLLNQLTMITTQGTPAGGLRNA